jgi:RNA polymerase sigma factor (sigma-70 family)
MKILEQYSDAAIIGKVLEGELALFEILIRRNNPFLYKTGRSYNFNHEDTQDLMQDSFIDAYTGLKNFENRSSFKTWVIRIMLNNCFRKTQRSAYKNEVANEITDKSIPMFTGQEHTDANKTVVNRELNTVIENALQQMPLDYRMVFSLREMNGLKIAETAAVLNTSEANVKVRLNRAKTLLRKEIEKFYSPEDIFEFNLRYCDAITNNIMDKLKSMNEDKR